MWGNDGGFMDGGNAGEGFVNSPSQFASPAQGKKERRSQDIVPVTIKTIQDSSEENLVVGGSQVSMVVVVGIIRSVEVSTRKITYKIDDSTGIIDGIHWLESDSTADDGGYNKSPLMENTYSKIVASVRTQERKKYLMIFNAIPITDINRITTHILEVLHAPMKLKMLQEMRENGPQQMATNEDSRINHSSDTTGGGMMNTQGLVGQNKIIYQMIKMETSEKGIHKQAIYDATAGKINRFAVDKILEDLGSEGLVYTTIDDDHFKSAENC